MKISQSFYLLSLKLTFLLTIGLAGLDVVKYNGFVQNHLGLSTIQLGLTFSILHLVIHFFKKISLGNEFATNLLKFAFPLTAIISLIMIYVEKFGAFYPNFFFAEFGIDYQSLSNLGLIFLIFGLSNSNPELWGKQYKQLNLVLSTGLLFAAFFLYLDNPILYKKLIAEDGLVEMLAAIGFAVSAFLCFKLRSLVGQKMIRDNWRKIVQFLLFIAGLGFILVAGEEISWGQRIFNIATPESVAEINRQGEINLHNLENVWPFVYKAYLLIGVYGASAWILRWIASGLLSKNKKIENYVNLFVPSGYLILNFAMIIVYVLLRQRHGIWRFVAIEEISELLLCIGITLHLFENIKSIKPMADTAK